MRDALPGGEPKDDVQTRVERTFIAPVRVRYGEEAWEATHVAQIEPATSHSQQAP